MKCTRCHGSLVPEYAYDLANSGSISASLWKCVQCGDRIDPIILANRARQADARRLVSQAETIAQLAWTSSSDGGALIPA